MEKINEGTFSAVWAAGGLTEWLKTMIVGVLQGCILSPLLFNIFRVIIMSRAQHGVDAGVVICEHVVNNLRFA